MEPQSLHSALGRRNVFRLDDRTSVSSNVRMPDDFQRIHAARFRDLANEFVPFGDECRVLGVKFARARI